MKKDDLEQGFLEKQRGEKHTKKLHAEKTETVEEARHRKASLKKTLAEIEQFELEHDDELGEDFSRYIK